MAYDYAANVLRLRKLANDTAASNLASQEVPKGTKDGANVNFRVQNQNVVVGSVYVTLAGDVRSQVGFTVDAPNGLLAFAIAPPQDTEPFEADYNWQWFTDAEYTEFLDQGAEVLGVAKGSDVTEGLIPAQMQFALYYYYMRRAVQYAHRYAASGGIVGQQVDVVTKNFRDLGKCAWDAGSSLRDMFYKRQGQREAPASTAFNYNFDPFTPRR